MADNIMGDQVTTATDGVKFRAPMTFKTMTLAQRIDGRTQEMTQERSDFMDEWKDISDYIQIRRGRYLITENRKRKRPKKVLHEAGPFASRVLGAGMLAGVSSPSRPWLKLATPDGDLNEYKSVKAWLDIAQKRLYQVFTMSNYYHVKQTAFRDMGDFGQGPVLIDQDFDNVINLYCSPPGEYLMSVDTKGVVDTLYREMKKTTLQVISRWGYNAPDEIKAAYDRGDNDRLWSITHAVEPNLKYIEGAPGPLGMPWSSVYVCTEVSHGTDGRNGILEVKGYRDNPISAPRWEVQANDVYGDGPGALALPAVKSLQVLERRKGQIVDKLAVPPMQGPADMETNGRVVNHTPGGMSFYGSNPTNGDPIRPLYQVDPRSLDVVNNEERILENRIQRAYFNDLFLQLSQSDRRQITAREIEERHEEKLIQLGPVLERTHYEGLNIEVKRAFGILSRSQALPPPPEELDGVGLKVEYTSLLAVAQRAVGVSTIERFSGFMGNMSAGNPEIMDKWDMDQSVDEYADAIGIAASIVRSDEEVAKIREDRKKQQQQMEQMAMAQQGAESAKVLSQADTGRGSNLLADIMGNQGRVI
jgi:hypothetical protein